MVSFFLLDNLFNLILVYGKTVENVKEYKDIRVCFNKKTFMKHSRKPNFSRGAIYDNISNNFGCVELTKKEATLNKPRCKYQLFILLLLIFLYLDVGVTVLALAKWIMYDFHYETIMKTFGENSVRLLFTDTDSLW